MKRTPNEPDNKAAERLAQFLEARESQPQTDDVPTQDAAENVATQPPACEPDSRPEPDTHQPPDKKS